LDPGDYVWFRKSLMGEGLTTAPVKSSRKGSICAHNGGDLALIAS
jgi:hypothetical protein